MPRQPSTVQLPTHLHSARQIEELGIAQLNEDIIEIYRQAAVLSIREWFQEYSKFDLPFTIIQQAQQKFTTVVEEGSPDEAIAALDALIERMHGVCHPHNEMVLQHAVILMNALHWPRGQVDFILGAVLDVNTQIGGQALFALVDARLLEESSCVPPPSTAAPRL